MKTLTLFLLLVTTAMLLGGCGEVKSNIAVFHTLPETPTHMKYAFVATEQQEGSVEYETYQGLIRAELQRFGYQETSIDEADVIVGFSYGIDAAREKLTSMPNLLYGAPSSSETPVWAKYSDFGPPVYYTETLYFRRLKFYMFDKESMASGKMKTVYEANVVSTGSSPQLAKVVPVMIKALFEEFPGKSGSTRTETIFSW